jgi:hypothetical protein
MATLYGGLRGRPDRYEREDNASTPHLQIRVVDASGQPWRIAVNVQESPEGGTISARRGMDPSKPSACIRRTARSSTSAPCPHRKRCACARPSARVTVTDAVVSMPR